MAPALLLAGNAVLLVCVLLVPWLSPVALVVFVPALIVLRNRSIAQWAKGSAWLFFLFAIGGYYWIAYVTYRFGNLPMALAGLTVLLFAGINAWQGMLGFVLFRWLRDARIVPPALLFAVCAVTTWHMLPAMFFWDWSILVLHWTWLIQNIDLIGTYGLDLFIAFANYAAFESWRDRRVTRSAVVAVGVLVLLLGYGAVRIRQLERQLAAAKHVRVALIQPSFDSGAKADINNVQASLRTLFALSDTAAQAAPDLIVWPEATFPIDYSRDPHLQRLLGEKVRAWDTALFFGNNRFEKDASGRWRNFNAATLVTPTLPAQYYSKHVLLAFGEYIPLEAWLPIIRRWIPDRVGAFGRGAGPTRLAADTFSFAPVICYESIIADYMRRSAALPIDFITEISNDGWYGRTAALRYHKDLTRLRAIENRISIARDTNTGITTFVDPLGREHQTLRLETPGVALYDIPQVRPYAFFTRYGHYALPLGIAVTLILVAYSLWRRR